VRVVDVEPQVVVAGGEGVQLGGREEVGVHRVEAVGGVPDPAVRGPVALQPALQGAQVVVRDELDMGAVGLDQLGRRLHRVVDLVVHEQDVAAAQERRHRGDVPHGRRRRHDDRPAEQVGELRLGGAVQG
jgi:hypothetical protein